MDGTFNLGLLHQKDGNFKKAKEFHVGDLRAMALALEAFQRVGPLRLPCADNRKRMAGLPHFLLG